MRRGAGTFWLEALAGRGWGPVCLLLVLATLPALGSTIEGQVFDGAGTPLAGVSVRVVQVPPAPLFPGKNRPPAPPLEIARTRTDPKGFFRVELAGWRPRGRIQLLVGDVGAWDGLRYARPDPRDLTREVRRGEPITVTIRVPDAPGWADLERAIEMAGGPASPLGRLLRRHGFPRRVTADASGRVVADFGEVRRVLRGGVAAPPGDRPRPAAERGGERP